MLRVDGMPHILRQPALSRVSLRPFEGVPLEEALYHVQLEGKTVGPYDRRTIVGMRAKETLADATELIGPHGQRLTVEDLLRHRPDEFSLTGTFSIVKARFDAQLFECDRSGPLPRYDDQLEVRVQPDVLRIAGRLKGKDDRVKIPLGDVVHARARGTFTDLWLRDAGTKRLQSATLQLDSPERAAELVKWLPEATPPSAAALSASRMPIPYGIVIGVAGAVLAIVAVVLAIALKR
jgi:hypothetical protein